MSKILFFSGVPIDDAATFYRSGLVARKFTKMGYQTVFVSVSRNFKKEEKKKIASLPVFYIGQAHYSASKSFYLRKRLGIGRVLFENFKICLRMFKLLKREKPDRVLVITPMPVSLLVGFVAKVLGFRTFLDIEDLVSGQMEASGYPKILVKIYEYFEKVLVKIFDKVSVCSFYLQKRYPGSVILPNMVDFDFWRRRKRKMGDGKNIVFVGQMGVYHGQIEVLKKFASLLKENNNLSFIFVGGGEIFEDLKSEILNLGLEKKVILTGQVSQKKVREILQTCEVGILPLWDIPVHKARHPLKLLEYLASGLVVITNKVGEAERIIKNGENGILCPPGDIKCLVRKTEVIIRSPDLAKKIKRKAVDSVKDFSSEKILPKWIEFLEI